MRRASFGDRYAATSKSSPRRRLEATCVRIALGMRQDRLDQLRNGVAKNAPHGPLHPSPVSLPGSGLKDSGLEVTEANATRIGVNIGSGIGGLPMIEETITTC